MDTIERNDRMIEDLNDFLSPDEIIIDIKKREFYSTDVYSRGSLPSVIIRPKNKEQAAKAVSAVNREGYVVIPRGGGMSYTGGYRPVREDTVTFDMSSMNNILEINEEDMYITVEAGVTWKQIYDALNPLGLRLPFFGTFSGYRATVGGGLSNGALFMGTGRYGTAAEIVQCIEVVLADGTILKTGQPGFENVTKPFYRTYGPDLTGLFVHDAGTFGVKVQATLKMIKKPNSTDFASFCFPDMWSTAAALSDVARSGAAEEAYVFDPGSTKKNLKSSNIVEDIKTLGAVFKNQKNWLSGLVEGTKLVVAGRDFLEEGAFSMHIVVSGNGEGSTKNDLNTIRELIKNHGGEEIPNSIPKAVRADPFKPLNSILGPDGDRWAAMNAKIAHSDAISVMQETEEMLDSYKSKMESCGVFMTRLMIAIGQHSFSYEPVFHWFDEWYPIHKETPEPSHLKNLSEPKPNPAATELVSEMRQKIVEIFKSRGVASNQIGKTYPYFQSLKPETAKIIKGIKDQLDPNATINPGGLGFPLDSDN